MNKRTIEKSHGRWREILITLGVEAKFLTKKNGPCPMCGGTDRFSFTDRGGDGDYLCRACGAGKGVQLVMRLKGLDYATAFNEVDKIIGNLPITAPVRREAKAQGITSDELNKRWRAARMIASEYERTVDPVGRYFERRGLFIDGPSYDKVLRYHPSLWHAATNQNHPAMIAKFCDADGKPKHLHQTFLTHDGEKIAKSPRLYTPGELPKGGAIRLGPVEEVMGVAEGIETALAASIIHNMPVWATTSASMLQHWQPPVIVKRVVIFGDNDRTHAGQRAAHTLAERLVHEADRDKIEREIEVAIPLSKGDDWNDALRLLDDPEQPPLASFDGGKAEREAFSRAIRETDLGLH